MTVAMPAATAIAQAIVTTDLVICALEDAGADEVGIAKLRAGYEVLEAAHAFAVALEAVNRDA